MNIENDDDEENEKKSQLTKISLMNFKINWCDSMQPSTINGNRTCHNK